VILSLFGFRSFFFCLFLFIEQLNFDLGLGDFGLKRLVFVDYLRSIGILLLNEGFESFDISLEFFLLVFELFFQELFCF
jgi:hypothetical protein